MISATPSTAHRRPLKDVRGTLAWLAAAVAAFAVISIGLSDGVAEPPKAEVSWTVVAAVTVLAVMVIAKGLDRLLDCESP